MEFGEAVEQYRREQKLKQNFVAELIGISIPYMNQIETGKRSVENIGDHIFNQFVNKLDSRLEVYRPAQSATAQDKAKATQESEQTVAFDVERQGWEKLEQSLRDRIAQQEERIKFQEEHIKQLLSLLQSAAAK